MPMKDLFMKNRTKHSSNTLLNLSYEEVVFRFRQVPFYVMNSKTGKVYKSFSLSVNRKSTFTFVQKLIMSALITYTISNDHENLCMSHT
jgi:hypothetical protein